MYRKQKYENSGIIPLFQFYYIHAIFISVTSCRPISVAWSQKSLYYLWSLLLHLSISRSAPGPRSEVQCAVNANTIHWMRWCRTNGWNQCVNDHTHTETDRPRTKPTAKITIFFVSERTGKLVYHAARIGEEWGSKHTLDYRDQTKMMADNRGWRMIERGSEWRAIGYENIVPLDLMADNRELTVLFARTLPHLCWLYFLLFG